MTNEEILIEALEEAEFDKCIILSTQLEIERLGEEVYFKARNHWRILFDNKFCQNIFGEGMETMVPERGVPVGILSWVHHQQQMLKYIQEEKEPLKYIERF